MRKKTVVLLFVIIAIGCVLYWFAPHQPSGQFIWLDTEGWKASCAYDVSRDGKVIVGYVQNAQDRVYPALWKHNGTRWVLEQLGQREGVAFGVSDSGRYIVGIMVHGQQGFARFVKGFCWDTKTGNCTLLPGITETVSTETFLPYADLQVRDICEEKQMIIAEIDLGECGYWVRRSTGWSWIPVSDYEGVYGLQTISKDGKLIGGTWNEHPILWRFEPPQFWRKELLYPGSLTRGRICGFARTQEGTVAVGWRRKARERTPRPVKWVHKNGQWIEQVLIDSPFVATGVSEDGHVVVGHSYEPDESALYYKNGSIYFLNDVYRYELNRTRLNLMIQNVVPNRKVSFLSDANAVSGDGRWVVGRGYNAQTRRYEAYVAFVR